MTDKKTVSIWHLDNTRDAGWTETPAAWPVGYTKVAQVEGDDLEDVFRITNSIDSAWWLANCNHDVPTSGIRSSSVGDVCEIDGVGYRIATTGFDAVSGHPGIEKGRVLDEAGAARGGSPARNDDHKEKERHNEPVKN